MKLQSLLKLGALVALFIGSVVAAQYIDRQPSVADGEIYIREVPATFEVDGANEANDINMGKFNPHLHDTSAQSSPGLSR